MTGVNKMVSCEIYKNYICEEQTMLKFTIDDMFIVIGLNEIEVDLLRKKLNDYIMYGENQKF